MPDLDPRARAALLEEVRALPLNTLFVQSVLCEHVDGRVVTDVARAPAAFYAVHPYGMALLWGRDRGRGYAWLRPCLLARHAPVEWLQVHPHTWTPIVEDLLGLAAGGGGADGPSRCTRVNFAFDRDAYHRARHELSAELERATIVPTTAELAARIEGSVVPLRFWRDAAQFARQAGGFTAIVAGEPVATAFCSYRHGEELEIGIETAPAHRGQGHARLVACALIDACLRRGLVPVWACRLENTGSYQLATRLGFVPTLRLPYYRLP